MRKAALVALFLPLVTCFGLGLAFTRVGSVCLSASIALARLVQQLEGQP